MKVRDLTPFLSDPLVEGAVEREFTGITHDSRRVTPGMLFVAAPGLQQDGGAFMASAVERGASVVLCARDAAAPSRVTRIRVADVRVLVCRIVNNPSRRSRHKVKPALHMVVEYANSFWSGFHAR